MTKQNRFHTRLACNNSIKLFLSDPETGEETEEYIEVVGVHSDAFREAENNAKRVQTRARLIAKRTDIGETEKERLQNELMDAVTLDVCSSLVVGWSFDEEPTRENVRQFLRDAPQIMDGINIKASDVSVFIAATKSNSSSPTSEDKKN